ncbi:MAG TPA: Gfo/Idh/MocA family oxidoreductase [Bryobacteraceae bacterium]|nr:Gfo/Idh/MocA family oxidoreductase [Bryobacteraceae bacterium]
MIGRRDFLKSVAAGAALPPAFVPARALGRDGVVAPGDRITVACIGTGWQGGNNVDSFLEEPGAQVVAVCDIDADHLETARQAVNKKYGNQDCKTYHEFEEVLARKDIDALMLAVPDHWHGVLSTAAVAAGKDIYGEKPLAQNFAEGRAICEAVERYQCVWQTGSWQRSRDDFRRACELVINGRIGKISRVKVVLPGGLTDFDSLGGQDSPVAPPKTLDYKRWLGPAPEAPYSPARVHKTWRWNLDYGGGMLMDWVGHHVDTAHWGLGYDNTGPVEVNGTGEFLPSHRVWNAPSRFKVTARYATGVVMEITGGYDARRGVTWYGDDGWIWVDRSGIDAQPRSVLMSRIRPDEIRFERSTNHHRQFLECVKSRRRTLAPPGVALRSATPGYLGLISILTGTAIRWNPEQQRIVGNPTAERLLSRPMRGPWHI